MKKTILIVMVALAVALTACEINNDTDSTKTDVKSEFVAKRSIGNNIECGELDGVPACYTVISSIDSEDGNVNSWFGTDTTPTGDYDSPFTVGKEVTGFISKDYKAIVSFDTSIIPEGVEIAEVSMPIRIDLTSYNESFDQQVVNDFLYNNYTIEYGKPLGFGSSSLLSGFDFFDVALSSVKAVDLPFHIFKGVMLDKNMVNRNGKTQLRFTLPVNPYSILVKHKFQAYMNSGPARLQVYWYQ